MIKISILRHKYWLLGVVFLVVCIVLAILGFSGSANETGEVSTSTAKLPADQSNTAPKPPDLVATITALRTAIPAKFTNLSSITGPDTANNIGFPLPGYNFTVVMPYTAETAAIFSGMSGTGGVTANDAYHIYQKALPNVVAALQQAGFQELVTSTSESDGLQTKLFFQRPDAYCNVVGYSLLDITCATKADLTKVADAAKPLMAAYAIANPTTGTEAIAQPWTEASKTPGYSIASIMVFDGNSETKVNLSKQDGGGWQPVNLSWYNDPQENANIEPNCQYFESQAQTRLAFAGQACYNSATRKQSTIR